MYHRGEGGSDLGPAGPISRALGSVLHEFDVRPALDLDMSCLGERTVGLPETDRLFAAGGESQGVAQGGLCPCGEIAPSLPGGISELHNQTMTVTAFAES